MTQHSTSETAGLGEGPMRIDWRDIRTPEQFAEACRWIIRDYRGHEAHRQMDRLTNELLSNLGFGEGATLFAHAVQDWHHSQLEYPFKRHPRWKCRLGFHHWRADRESNVPWAHPEICTSCGARQSASLHEICP